MFIATLKLKRGIQVIFISLAVLFFLLTAGEITGSTLITVVAGYEAYSPVQPQCTWALQRL